MDEGYGLRVRMKKQRWQHEEERKGERSFEEFTFRISPVLKRFFRLNYGIKGYFWLLFISLSVCLHSRVLCPYITKIPTYNRAILASQGYCNKSPQNESLKVTDVYELTVLEAGSPKSRCLQGFALTESFRGEPVPCSSLSSWGCQ